MAAWASAGTSTGWPSARNSSRIWPVGIGNAPLLTTGRRWQPSPKGSMPPVRRQNRTAHTRQSRSGGGRDMCQAVGSLEGALARRMVATPNPALSSRAGNQASQVAAARTERFSRSDWSKTGFLGFQDFGNRAHVIPGSHCRAGVPGQLLSCQRVNAAGGHVRAERASQVVQRTVWQPSLLDQPGYPDGSD